MSDADPAILTLIFLTLFIVNSKKKTIFAKFKEHMMYSYIFQKFLIKQILVHHHMLKPTPLYESHFYIESHLRRQP